MLPVLFHLGPFVAHSYGFFIVLGILAGLLVGRAEFRRLGVPPDHATDIILIGIVVGVAGGKLVFLLTLPWAEVARDPWGMLSPRTGLVWYGVLAAVFLSTWLYARYRRQPSLRVLDVSMLGLALGHGIGRIGCFLAGCCYGRPTDLPWGVVFHHPASFAPRGVSLHPTQLYMAGHGVLVFALMWWFRRFRRRDGELTLVFVAAYAVGRFVIEFFRGDAVRGTLGGLSTSQTLSLVALAAAGLGLAWMRRKVPGG